MDGSGSGKNILVVDWDLPMYDRASGSLRLFNILKTLRNAGHYVTFLALQGARQERYIDELEKMGVRAYAADIHGPKVLTRLLAARDYDLAWLSFYFVAEKCLGEIRRYSPKTAVVIDTVDVHYLREERMGQIAGDQGVQKQAAETKARELAIYPRADSVLTVTDDDRQVLRKEIPQLPVAVIPNIHDVLPRTKPFNKRAGLLFVGNFNHPPNLDAVNYFIMKIWPVVKGKIPGIKIYIVGDRSEEFCRFHDKNIKVTGFVPDTQPYLQACRVSVAPLRYGAGMKGKIGEAMISGIPVVTTDIGSEGMGLVDGKHVLVANNPDEFATAITRLYTDEKLWHNLVENGKNHIKQNYSTEAVAKKLDNLVKGVKVMVKQPVVSIIIPTFNQLGYTKLCLTGIRRFTPEPYELIVVDNSSTDGTIDYLMSQKDIIPIINKENKGFSKACNQGIKAAAGKHLLLLNNDTIVGPNWLRNLIRCLESDSSTGIVGPRSNFAQQPQYLKVNYRSLGEMLEFSKQFNSRPDPAKWFELNLAVGFCMLIRWPVIEKAGLLDERFGIGNFEDNDFCNRAKAAGFKIMCAGDTFVHHFGNRTFIGNNMDYNRIFQENRQKYHAKWGKS